MACVAGAGAGAATTGATTLTSPGPDPDAELVGPPPPEAAAALVLAADALSAASVRWSAAITTDRRASVRALAASWLLGATDALEGVALVVGTTVELTKALAIPAPTKAIDVTTIDGRMRRRARDRPSARAPRARFMAIR